MSSLPLVHVHLPYTYMHRVPVSGSLMPLVCDDSQYMYYMYRTLCNVMYIVQ